MYITTPLSMWWPTYQYILSQSLVKLTLLTCMKKTLSTGTYNFMPLQQFRNNLFVYFCIFFYQGNNHQLLFICIIALCTWKKWRVHIKIHNALLIATKIWQFIPWKKQRLLKQGTSLLSFKEVHDILWEKIQNHKAFPRYKSKNSSYKYKTCSRIFFIYTIYCNNKVIKIIKISCQPILMFFGI